MTNTDEDIEVSPPEMQGVGIRVQGQLVAWFADPEMAENWARENFFGQWLAHPCSMPNRPAFSKEHILEAECTADELARNLGILD